MEAHLWAQGSREASLTNHMPGTLRSAYVCM